MTTYAILSDDLTGAMDTGLQMAKKGYRVYVAFDDKFIGNAGKDIDILVFDTESRNIPASNAVSRVKAAVSKIKDAGLELIYKKTDSSLRGNIGSEMEAALSVSGADMIAFAPALPLNGRTTGSGCHRINGYPLTESDLAKDPFSPVKSSYIPEIIGYQTAVKCGVIDLENIRAGADDIARRLEELYLLACRIVILDAETMEDLYRIGSAIKLSKLRILPCGSAGLFMEMFRSRGARKGSRCAGTLGRGPVLTVSGSPARASKQQILAAERQGIRVIRPDRAKISEDSGWWLKNGEKTVNRILDCLNAGEDIIVDGAGEGKEELYRAYGDRPEMLVSSSSSIQAALSDIFLKVLSTVALSGAVILGGDTALNICRSLGAEGLEITGEVEPFVPSGRMIGGKGDMLPVVTKAGGFGTEQVVINAIGYLKRGGMA